MTTHLLLNERPLQVLPTLAAIFGINEAIAIQQIHWVITIKHEHHDDKTFYEDFMWCKYTLNQWGEKMPWLSGSSIFRLFKKLENEGIVKTIQPYASSRDQTKWYRIDYDILHVRSKNASSQNDDLPSSQNDQIRSSQNDYMINRSKDLKNLNKKQSDSFSENSQEQEKLHPEQKTDPLSDLSKPEDPKTPPLPPLSVAGQKLQEQFEGRFKNKPNRYAPQGLVEAGFGEWHLGEDYDNWRPSLIKVAQQVKRELNQPCGIKDATKYLYNTARQSRIEGHWGTFQGMTKDAIAIEQSQHQRSQQQPTPQLAPPEDNAVYTVPSFVKDFAKSRKVS